MRNSLIKTFFRWWEKPDEVIVAGVTLFNQNMYREALLKFEEPWQKSYGQRERFLRGLIQVAGTYHHWKEGRMESALVLCVSSQDLLNHYPSDYLGVNVLELREQLAQTEKLLRKDATFEESGISQGLFPGITFI